MKRDAALVVIALALWVGFLGYWWGSAIQLTSAGVIGGVALTAIAVAVHYAKGTGWEPAGDISAEVLERRAETVPETEFPEPMNRSIGGGGAVAVGAGAAEGELAEGEAAEEDEAGFDPSALLEDEIETFEIDFEKEGQSVEVASNENLLEAGEDEGWDLPYACREGQCLSCAGRIVDGDAQEFIRHDGNEMLNEEEMGEGYCLTCVAYPIGDFTLETSESP